MGLLTSLVLLSFVCAGYACKSSLYGKWTDAKTNKVVTFDSTGVTGWDVSLFSYQVTSWKCHDESTDQILLSSSPVSIYNMNFVVYRCLQLKKETDCKYTITFQNAEEYNAGNARVSVLLEDDVATLSMCSAGEGESRTITKNDCN
uniref:Uncharacterized protein LOC111123135 n=1 Tax=Crassostrea virginica TaxID=6565 RepID=A0A8B8CYT6_CRAVI|nr:uncharacterized protein LOC111123135 [Crassostrea virginica]XP_022320985.1 uncharacterized protein LOC111123135 [Crassostrea virginica]